MNHPLLDHLDHVLDSSAISSTKHTDLRALVEGALRAREGRAASARERSAEISDRARGRIRAAWGCSPLDGDLDAMVRTCRDRMLGREWKANPRTIRSELLLMRSEMQTGTGLQSIDAIPVVQCTNPST